MPFGNRCEFANFDACIKTMAGKVDDPDAYCAVLMRKTEAKCARRQKEGKDMGIEFLGQKFTVKLTREPIGGEDGDRSFYAQTDQAENVVIIDGTMPKSRQEECLMHEMIHLCDMAMPEWMVGNLSRNLYGILRENDFLKPNLVEKVQTGWLSKAEAEKLNEASNKMAEGRPIIVGRQTEIKYAVTNQAWEGDAAQYNIEQWRRATLIHLDGVDPNLKSSHKLPVKEPNGDINRNGCHAAAAVLGGARGGVDAPADKKRAAAKALIRIYRDDLDEEPPESLKKLAGVA